MVRTLRSLVVLCSVLFAANNLSAQDQVASLDREEELSSQSEDVLYLIGEFLEGKRGHDKLTKVIADPETVEIPRFDYIPLELPGNFSVNQNSTLVNESSAANSFEALKSSFDGRVLRTKFKTIQVTIDPDRAAAFSTNVLASIFLETRNGHREIHSQWTAGWKIVENRVVLTTLRESARNEARLKSGQLGFVDESDRVLRFDEYTTAAIKNGANQWLQRLELPLKPDFFALSGVSVADVNGDDREDVYVCQLGGLPNLLFVQQKDGTFVNSASEAGVDLFDNSTCAIFVDFDNDGDQDMAIATSAGIAIYENSSKGKFRLTNLNRDIAYTYSMCAADYDRDGLVDLYACQYYGSRNDRENATTVQGSLPVPHPVFDANNGGRNALLKNVGDLKFEDVTKSTGLDSNNSRFSYAAMWEDWDNDGDQDLYVANDFGQNNFYRNDGSEFVDATRSARLNRGEFSMGVTAGDYNGDGWMDLHISNMFSSAGSRVTRQSAFKADHDGDIKDQFQLLARGNSLATNQGDGTFQDTSVSAGITVGRWSWSSLSTDINNDGYEDLLVANGFVTGNEDSDDL